MELIPPNTNINFIGNRYYAYLFTTILVVLSLASIPIIGPIKLGVDFSGGVMIQVKFNKTAETDQIRQALEPLGENLVIQKFSGAGEEFVIRTDIPASGGDKLSQEVSELLEKKFGKGSFEIRGLEMVGPKVGKDLQESAIWATVIALGLLLIYMAFRFTLSMGLGAVFCLVHDLIIIYGFFAWTGKEFNLTILAAALTVIGYDINDSIVVCDRIRDTLKTSKSPTASERFQWLVGILNSSINQTLSRTVLTAGFTLLVVISLLIFGTSVVQDFAWAMLVGIVFGTYSSIFVASPIVLALDKYIPLKTR